MVPCVYVRICTDGAKCKYPKCILKRFCNEISRWQALGLNYMVMCVRRVVWDVIIKWMSSEVFDGGDLMSDIWLEVVIFVRIL